MRNAKSFILLGPALLLPRPALAMHISEGILPLNWALFWAIVVVPFIGWGIWRIRSWRKTDPSIFPLLGLFGAAVFVFSCFPIPVPVAGSTSHPAGTALTAILFGPPVSVVIALVALLLQALFLAHGGLTTLGGNLFSMGVLGSFCGLAAFRIGRQMRFSLFWSGFVAGMAADLATYFGTALEMALALHGDESIVTVFSQIYLAFMPTQVPLSMLEGAVIGGLLVYVQRHRPDILLRLKVTRGEAV